MPLLNVPGLDETWDKSLTSAQNDSSGDPRNTNLMLYNLMIWLQDCTACPDMSRSPDKCRKLRFCTCLSMFCQTNPFCRICQIASIISTYFNFQFLDAEPKSVTILDRGMGWESPSSARETPAAEESNLAGRGAVGLGWFSLKIHESTICNEHVDFRIPCQLSNLFFDHVGKQQLHWCFTGHLLRLKIGRPDAWTTLRRAFETLAAMVRSGWFCVTYPLQQIWQIWKDTFQQMINI